MEERERALLARHQVQPETLSPFERLTLAQLVKVDELWDWMQRSKGANRAVREQRGLVAIWAGVLGALTGLGSLLLSVLLGKEGP